MKHQPNFNLIARPYRWLEYLTLGKALENCREHYLPQLLKCRRALILGDGDGRFLQALLASNSELQADAVDASSAMLHLLRKNCHHCGDRVQTHHISALDFTPSGQYDLVVTHFFLDCFSQPEVEAIAARIAPALSPGGLWLVSDFRIPPGPIRLPAFVLVRGLYIAFRILTGLRVKRLPNHAAALTQAGMTPIAHHYSFAGLLLTEIWQRRP